MKQKVIWALIDFNSKFNTITPTYAAKLGFIKQKANIRAWKIEALPLKTYKIVLSSF